MPIVEIPKGKPAVEPNLKISDVPYEGAVVETRKQSFMSLATFSSGMKMACDYYSLTSGRDNAPASFQDDLPPVYGQYRLIKGFEIVVTSPLSHQQNNESTGEFVSTGSGTIYSVITPQNGEMFIADVGNGREAIFQINNPRRMGIFDESPTEVDFRLLHFVDKAFAERLQRLRVIKTVYFIRENYRNGVKCLLVKEEVDVSRRLVDAFRRLVPLYFKDFFADRYNTFIVPMQSCVTYDPNVVKFIKAILATEQHPKMNTLTELGVAHDVYSNQITIFDVLAARDYNLLYSASRHLGIASVLNMRQLPLMRSIVFSGVKQILMATDVAFSVNNPLYEPLIIDSLQKAGVRQPDMRSILPHLDLDSGKEPRPDESSYIKRVIVDGFYVLSKDFYEDTDDQSMLEVLVGQTLRGEAINLSDLADLADYATKFDNLERFYYTPIILALIKMAPGVL